MRPRRTVQTIYLILALTVSACSAIEPTDTGGPRANEPVYPIVLTDDPQRHDATLTAIRQFMGQPASAETGVTLQPITSTIQSLRSSANRPVYLPKLGTAAEMTEEETRESLRRFITEWQNIIGADPEDLSLVTNTKQPDGTQLVIYEQRPFRFPLRGNHGRLQIRFGMDRRVLDITSTCIPDADRLQPLLAATTPTVTPEDAVKFVAENGISHTGPDGQTQLVKPAIADINARELVIYISGSSPAANALDFHLAWEIEVENSAVKKVYLDAVKSQIIATE
jgi:hypothetical protein